MTTYDDAVLADSPDTYLPLNDASGTTAVALAGSGGTYVSDVALGVTGPTNVIDTAIATTGANDYVSIPLPGLASNVAQSFEWWAAAPIDLDASAANWSVFASPADTSHTYVEMGNARSTIANEVLMVRFHGSGTTYWTGLTIPAGWHHHVLTYNGTQGGWEWYVDGVNITDPAWGGTKVQEASGSAGLTHTSIMLGYRVSAVEKDWDGWACFARYPSELTATQVADHYDAAFASDIWTDLGSRSPMVMG